MKKFKVVAESTTMDVEMACHDKDTANEMFLKFKDSGSYYRVYIADNETGEVYRTYDCYFKAQGVQVDEWFKIEW